MKKIAIVFLFLIGFVLVFVISGMVAFTVISDNQEMVDVATEAVADNNVAFVPVDSNGNKLVTRVTPGLKVEETVITYGDEVYKEETEGQIPEAEIIDDEPQMDSPKPADVKVETKQEKKEEVKADTNKETKKTEVKADTKKEEVKTEVKTEGKKEEAPKAEEKPQETAKETVEIKKEEVKTEAVEEPKKEEQPQSSTDETTEQQKPQTPVEEPEVEEKPKVELNPDIKTSDTGL